MLSRRDWFAASAVAATGPLAFGRADAHPTDLAPDGPLTDPRLGALKTLNDHHPFAAPKTLDAWKLRRQQVREQLLVTTGLHPMPAKTPLNPVVHGKIDRDGYTVEKVFFASMPGHYVCGNLYTPTTERLKNPGILFAHGHWADGRLHDAGEKAVKKDVPAAEKTAESARYPLQALPAALAKMGFVVFVYDMVGVADSTAIPHGGGFADAAAELRLQSAFGLQTWNSVRALDFLTSLGSVDATKIGMTGASGGGTQTFILAAIDDRITVAGPAVMVSTGMQGGCVCENASLLRVGTGNVEIAATFAPKPMALTCANDWTVKFLDDGFPQLKEVYALYGKADAVTAKAWPEFGHNYNQHAREFVYSWFRKHLQGGDSSPVTEPKFVPVPPKELSVFDASHPRPADEVPAGRLREAMAKASDAQLATPDAKVIRTWVNALTGGMPTKVSATAGPHMSQLDGCTLLRAVLGRPDQPDAVPAIGVFAGERPDKAVVWVHPQGKKSLFPDGKLDPNARALIRSGYAVIAGDVFGVGEATPNKPRPVDRNFAGYTFGYNRRPMADQARDILTLVGIAVGSLKMKTVHLVGWGDLGPATLLARSVCGDVVAKTAVDLNQLDFAKITSAADAKLLPGAVKYGGLGAVLAACAPAAVLAHNHSGTGTGQMSKAAYAAAEAADKLVREPAKQDAAKVVAWVIG